MSADLNPLKRAWKVLRERGALPADTSTEQIGALTRGLWARAFSTARVASASLLNGFKRLLNRYSEAGPENTVAKIREAAKEVLASMTPDPEPAPTPAGELTKDQLEILIDAEKEIAKGMVKKAAGASKAMLWLYPAWELVRVSPRKVPRGTPESHSAGWPERWRKGGGILHDGRMIALKSSPIWAFLGDPDAYKDACDVDVPPFAWNSGMGWKPIGRAECIRLGIISGLSDPAPVKIHAEGPDFAPIPKKTDAKIKKALLAKLDETQGALTREQLKALARDVLGGRGSNTADARAARALLFIVAIS